MEEENKISSVYIHIPFCSSICSYCDFCKFYYQDILVEKYLDILLQEIQEKYCHDLIDTLYIGGGTPSCLSPTMLNKLLQGLKILNVSPSLEFTIECNVLDLTEEKMILFQKYGVNRLSIGIQSFQPRILSFLGRNYNTKIIREKINLAKRYFTNINIDLIYAVPNETIKMLESDLEFFLSLGVPHISTYSLMIEPNTKLFIQKVRPINPELDQKMYRIIENKLKANHYIHYEISNYALPGYCSKHNLTYWKNEHYYGFGLSASGYIGNYRYTNTKNIKKYLSGNYIDEQEFITSSLSASNCAILGLRTIYGVHKENFLKQFGMDFIEYFAVQSLLDDHILLETDTNYYLNPKYWYLSNEVLIKFI